MKSRKLRRVLYSLLGIICIISILMLIPRMLSVLSHDMPPVGYHFAAADYLAIAVGLEKLVNLTPVIPDDIEEIKNIEYKNIGGKSLQLDIYKQRSPEKPAPLLVFIHGGGWKSGKRSDYLVYLIDFAKNGYVTATVSYRLLADSSYPACAEDIRDAVKWLFKNGDTYGYDPDRIALIGGSAGAHLAMLTGYGWGKSPSGNNMAALPADVHRIKAIVDIYGPVDLTTKYARTHSLVTNFLAHTFDDQPSLYKEASPVTWLDSSDPPTMILHGTSDMLVPVSQAVLLKHKLDSLGVPAELYRMPLWPHTMDVVKRVNEYSELKMNDFFERYLK